MRTADECRSYFTTRLRQRMCLVATRAFARFRVRRSYYVGLPREALRMLVGRDGGAGVGVQRDDMARWRLEDFYGYRSRAPQRGVPSLGAGDSKHLEPPPFQGTRTAQSSGPSVGLSAIRLSVRAPT